MKPYLVLLGGAPDNIYKKFTLYDGCLDFIEITKEEVVFLQLSCDIEIYEFEEFHMIYFTGINSNNMLNILDGLRIDV